MMTSPSAILADVLEPAGTICASCVPGYLRTDGVEFMKGDWIEIPDLGVGRFKGVWQNGMGLMTGLSFFRKFSDPSKHDNWWYRIGDVEEDVKPCLLDTAFKVSGPLSPNGKRPELARGSP